VLDKGRNGLGVVPLQLRVLKKRRFDLAVCTSWFRSSGSPCG